MLETLIVEDDLYLANTLEVVLKQAGYKTSIASTLEKAYDLLEKSHFDVVLLDRTLQDGDGLELVEYITQEFEETRILIVSQRCEIDERVKGLELGSDDYLVKPFKKKELLLRLERILRINKKQDPLHLTCGQMTLSLTTGELLFGENKKVRLRKKECQLLRCLFQYKNQVVSRNTIIKSVWGSGEMPSNTTVDVYIKRLRDILKKEDKIQTIRGFGYMIKDSDD